MTGTVLAVVFTGSITSADWSPQQHLEFRDAVTVAGLALTLGSAALVPWALVRARSAGPDDAGCSSPPATRATTAV